MLLLSYIGSNQATTSRTRNLHLWFLRMESLAFRLEKDQLHCEMKLHVATSEEARTLVDPVLRNWEMEVELAWSRGELRFTYEKAEIIDRTAPTPGAIRGHVMVALGSAYS